MKQIHQNRGFTLTETLAVIAIFTLIIGAIYSIHILSQRAYQKGERAAELTQNGRVISERIIREIRQAREIVNELPEEKVNPPGEIVFHEGHLSLSYEENTAQGGSVKSITLASDSSDIDDYYKNMFIKITEHTGAGQIRKINEYNGTTKVASLATEWETAPDAGSEYKIDSSYYYIRYFKDNDSARRQIFVYYFSNDPDTYVAWDDEDEQENPPGGPDDCVLEACPDCPTTCLILENRLVGEYITGMNFWGLEFINISLIFEKGDKIIDFQTAVSGRNL